MYLNANTMSLIWSNAITSKIAGSIDVGNRSHIIAMASWRPGGGSLRKSLLNRYSSTVQKQREPQ